MSKVRLSHGLLLLSALLPACAKKESPIVTVKGDCADVYQGQICTWARMQDSTVLAVGADIPVATAQNAPTTPEMAWPPQASAKLMLPAAAQKQAGFTTLRVYWEATGHPPAPFLTPHFDFHFYLEDPAAIEAIDCKDVSKPAALAAGYSLPDTPLPPDMAKMIGVESLIGTCVPAMGMHSLPSADLEGTTLFRGDMVIGYYQGKPIFIEPMISQAMLLEKKSFDLAIPEVPGMTAVHPHTYHAIFDSTAQAYHFEFTNFSAGN